MKAVRGTATFWVASLHPSGTEDNVRTGGASRHRKSIFCKAWSIGREVKALRSSAKPNTRVGAATSFARGGGFGLLASVATQRTMRAGRVPLGARSNPSINRTSPGKPGAAGYLKR
jgi:hypothetical protein